jgi:hypothetical protein
VLDLHLDQLRGAFGFGVAGNFAGHLEQAGEAGDFVDVVPVEPEAPKGIFPFFVPGSATFLGEFPLSHDALAMPDDDTPLDLQIEPEVGVLCRVHYADDGRVERLEPQALGAFNDCSIRRPGAAKISEKKNWGASSKGVAPRFFAIGDLGDDGPTRDLRLACFLRRDGATHAYGVDSPLTGYSYYGQRLLDWLADRLAHQRGGDGTPLEDVGALVREAGSPETVLVGIGATRYTDVGERTFLARGDEALVVVYDATRTGPEDVEREVRLRREGSLPAASVLRQTVV